jgi:hypothetical protein
MVLGINPYVVVFQRCIMRSYHHQTLGSRVICSVSKDALKHRSATPKAGSGCIIRFHHKGRKWRDRESRRPGCRLITMPRTKVMMPYIGDTDTPGEVYMRAEQSNQNRWWPLLFSTINPKPIRPSPVTVYHYNVSPARNDVDFLQICCDRPSCEGRD